MEISSGSRLGPYEIVSRIGAGGMGEVFKARDTRLERSVAIKVLPGAFSADSALKLRFEREAKAISQLNHPNICTLHDVGSHDGVEYLVMELIDGETLADRLTRGALPLSDVLRYGAQIAEALDRAHRAGIVHRDLKPGNVMLTRGAAKLLDFGLAKAAEPAVSTAGSEQTIQRDQNKSLTEKGTILGTFQYMAPEQLEGDEADARTDIFALGVVLYEMTTGRKAFEGKTRTSLIAAIVSTDPPRISELQPLTPPVLEHLIRKCISKDPEDRWQSAHDVAQELRWISDAGSDAVAVQRVSGRKSPARWLSYLAAAALAAALTAMFFTARRPAAQVIESSILPPDASRFFFQRGNMALAPDGSQLAFLAGDGSGPESLYVRPLSGGAAHAVPGSQGASYPFWSPDSNQLAFFAEGKLKVADTAGGTVQVLCDAPAARGGSWGKGGTILFAPTATDPLFKVSESGGNPVQVTKLGKSVGHLFPTFLPDGNHFVFFSADPTEPAIFGASLDGKVWKRLMPSLSVTTQSVPPDLLLFWRQGNIIAQHLDPRSLTLSGPPVTVAGNAGTSGRRGIFSASSNGELALFQGNGLAPTQLVWVDRQGRQLEALAPPALNFSPALSHDGRRLVYDVSAASSGNGDLWVYDLVRRVASKLTYNPENDSGPVWSPDDRTVVYFSDRPVGQTNLYAISSGGTGQEQSLLQDSLSKRPLDLSPDGRWLLVSTNNGRNSTDISLFDMTQKKLTPWLVTPFSEGAAQFSPDGRWVAYQSDESGRAEIYVRQFPDSQEKLLISVGGGTMPAWRRDGRELYYISPDRKMMSVSIETTPTLTSSPPVPLFDAHVREHPFRKQYVVSADGSKFLLNRLANETAVDPITLVQNWQLRLKNQ